MAKNKCTDNILWDNTGDGEYLHKTDCRNEFCAGLRKFWANHPYHLKGRNSGPIVYNGLFGTAEGIKIKYGTFPVYKKYSEENLIREYAAAYNIPIVIKRGNKGLFVFATEQSARRNQHLY